ncbi:hypothetical protein JW933_08405, partial [candidate division FCPU426 bacterium]|nr:hypothetical protein [candidate division FCPU426 bacterium]
PGDGRYTGTFKQTQFDGVYTFRFMARSGQISREKFVALHLRPRIQPQKSALKVVQREYRATDKLTWVQMTVTPKDRFGNKLGPGCGDLLQVDAKQAKIVEVKDKLDGSYEVQMTVPGDYKANPGLKSVFRRLDVKKRIGQ